jgi:hypothetical protein
VKPWFRHTLIATGTVNIAGASTFLPSNRLARDVLGFPPDVAPMYLWIVASWTLGFGLAYLWLAFRQTDEPLFIAIGAFGKVSFVAILIVQALAGHIPPRATFGGLWDLVVGTMFLVWLIRRHAVGTFP